MSNTNTTEIGRFTDLSSHIEKEDIKEDTFQRRSEPTKRGLSSLKENDSQQFLKIMYRSVPPCPSPDLHDHWTQNLRIKDPMVQQIHNRAKVIEINSPYFGHDKRSPELKFPMVTANYPKNSTNSNHMHSNPSSPRNKRKVQPAHSQRRITRNIPPTSKLRPAGSNQKLKTRHPTESVHRLQQVHSILTDNEKRFAVLRISSRMNTEKLYSPYESYELTQTADHIHNPELLTDSGLDDLTSLPKPHKVMIRNFRELPWVFRYKVKRANSTLAKIMASKPAMDDSRFVQVNTF